jgi:hypothetical protein
VQVVEDQQHRGGLGDGREQVDDRLEEPVARRRGLGLQRLWEARDPAPQRRHQQREFAALRPHEASQEVVRAGGGVSLQGVHHGVVGDAHLLVALAVQDGRPGVVHLGGELAGQPGLPHAGLTRQQHRADRPLPGPLLPARRLFPLPQQQSLLFDPAGERQRGGSALQPGGDRDDRLPRDRTPGDLDRVQGFRQAFEVQSAH